jgi:poly-beta-1,6-N-acetyl-D-glucosamine N-deacetylase
MTDNNSQKPQGFSLSLALVATFAFSMLNLGYTEPMVPILGFHGVIDAKSSVSNLNADEMHYSQQNLEKIIEYLIVNDYWFLTSQDLYDYFLTKSQKIPAEHGKQKPIMLSFDDGYKTIYTNLLPLLDKLEKKYGRKAKVVLFINPGSLAKQGITNSTHLGCQALREGLKKGFYDIQSHGLNHKNLTQLNRRDLVIELLQSRTELRKCTQDLDPEQKVASHFAYPYGAYNEQVENYVSKYYLSSYIYDDEILNYSCLKNYYQIPRLIINRRKSAKQLIAMAEKPELIKNKQKNQRKC